MVLKRFRSVPLADLEMMLPDKTVYIPPNQYVSVGITVISGLVALLTTFLQVRPRGWRVGQLFLTGCWCACPRDSITLHQVSMIPGSKVRSLSTPPPPPRRSLSRWA